MSQSLKATAQGLVQAHREVEPNLKRVDYYPDEAGREVRLVEVVAGSPTTNEILPFRFAPDPDRGVSFPVVIIELSPEEFELVQSGRLQLPEGWAASESLYVAA